MQNADGRAQTLAVVLEGYKGRNLGLTYSRPAGMRLTDKANIVQEYVDSDWAGCPDS
jgi:hypothetical protein